MTGQAWNTLYISDQQFSFAGSPPFQRPENSKTTSGMVGSTGASGLVDTSGLRHVDSNYDLPNKELTRLSRVIDDSHRHHYRYAYTLT